MRIVLMLALSFWATAGQAGVKQAVEGHILPRMAGFAEAAEVLADTAAADCRPGAVQPAYQAAFDAWMGVADLHLGPSEHAALSIAFWPDSRGFTPRTLSQLIAQEDPAVRDPAAFAEVSIAGRGFFALDLLLYDDGFAGYAADDYTCGLVQAVAGDLGHQARALAQDWQTYGETLTSAGAPANATYLDEAEAVRALYTQILAGLEFTADTRLGRPLGTFDKPRPKRAEAWRSDRSLRNVLLSAEAAHGLSHALSDTALPVTDEAMARLRDAAGQIADPAFQDMAEPQARFRAEVLQQAVQGLRRAIEAEIGAPLGIAPGFNSQDGD